MTHEQALKTHRSAPIPSKSVPQKTLAAVLEAFFIESYIPVSPTITAKKSEWRREKTAHTHISSAAATIIPPPLSLISRLGASSSDSLSKVPTLSQFLVLPASLPLLLPETGPSSGALFAKRVGDFFVPTVPLLALGSRVSTAGAAYIGTAAVSAAAAAAAASAEAAAGGEGDNRNSRRSVGSCCRSS